MWTPIDATTQLPPLQTFESNTLDFKGAAAENPIEIAKDVAALANSRGGSLVIGAYGGTRLEQYKAVPTGDAKRIIETYDRAVRDRCNPGPLVAFETLPYAEGFVIAVNVHPFPGQLVGVRILPSDHKGLDGLCFFPIRVGTHTKFISPDQLPMFIDGKMRRIAVALESAVDQQVALFDAFGSDRKDMYIDAARIRAVNPFTNSITLAFARRGGEATFTMPLDLVETVCHDGAHWNVYLRGSLEELDGPAGTEDALRGIGFVFRPSR